MLNVQPKETYYHQKGDKTSRVLQKDTKHGSSLNWSVTGGQNKGPSLFPSANSIQEARKWEGQHGLTLLL